MHRFYNAIWNAIFLVVLMSCRGAAAETVDWIVRANYVVTMDAQHRVIRHGAIAIQGARIAAVGAQADIEKRFQARQTLDNPDGLVMPGFIDTHTHAPMSLFRAIADDMRLDPWLQRFIFPAESKNVSPDFVRWGTRLACLEMLRAGITTYTDMYYFEDVEAETAKEAGVRGVLGETVIGFPSPDHKNWQETIAATEKYIQQFRNDDLIVPAVAPHSIYTTPDEALVAAHRLATKYNVPLLIHLAEMKKERDDAVRVRKMTPTEVLDKLGVLDGRVVAAHCIYESDDDLAILKRHGTGVAHCPSSNTKMASGVARVAEMLQQGVTVGLGTDGFAGSNDTADLMLEMDLAAKLQKITTMDPTVLPAEQVVAMATIGGAKVLGMEKEIGSLEAGKRADLISVSLDVPNAKPLYNVYSILAYAMKPGDVEDVFVNGREVVSARRVLTLNAPEIYRKAEEYREGIVTGLQQ